MHIANKYDKLDVLFQSSRYTVVQTTELNQIQKLLRHYSVLHYHINCYFSYYCHYYQVFILRQGQ